MFPLRKKRIDPTIEKNYPQSITDIHLNQIKLLQKEILIFQLWEKERDI